MKHDFEDFLKKDMSDEWRFNMFSNITVSKNDLKIGHKENPAKKCDFSFIMKCCINTLINQRLVVFLINFQKNMNFMKQFACIFRILL